MKDEIKSLVQQYNDKGWIAFIYPRKKMVSLNGFRAVSYQKAIQKIKTALADIGE